MSHRLPTEFAINMCLERIMILQQAELDQVAKTDYFNEEYPCHIYIIGRRPRVTVNKDSFKVLDSTIALSFSVHSNGNLKSIDLKFTHPFPGEEIDLRSEYPHHTFELLRNGSTYLKAKVSPFLQSVVHQLPEKEFLDFEVLYVGQSYGTEGARTAPERLLNHSTLQGIYAEAISGNPDSEIWIALTSFRQINLMVIDGRTSFTEEELKTDELRLPKMFHKLNREGLNEQQKINFTEAALIRYFQPPYNKIYKNTFPNPAHSTYSECYELDVNTVAIELGTYDRVGCLFYSNSVEKKHVHIENFFLHSDSDRKAMFDFTDY